MGTSNATDRGQANTIGIVLLIGIIITGSVGIVAMGGAQISNATDQAETRSGETAMSQFDSRASMVALGGAESQTVDLGLTTQNNEMRVEQRGRLIITIPGDGEIANRTLGSLVYENGDTVLAYQGGGVWRGTGNQSRMLSPPEMHYRGVGDEATLTMPVINVSGGPSVASSSVTISNGGSVAVFPTTSRKNPVVNQNVIVTIQSDYYVAWAEFFETRIGGGTNVTVDHANRTASVTLGNINTGTATFDAAVAANGDVTVNPGGDIQGGEVRASGSITGSTSASQFPNSDINNEPIDAAIEQKLSSAQTSGTTVSSDPGSLNGSGEFYVNGDFTPDGTIINTTGGNVTVAIDGNFAPTQLSVVGPNIAKLYVKGDILVGNGDRVNWNDGSQDASQLFVFGKSSSQITIDSGGRIAAAIYAPRDPSDPGASLADSGSRLKGALVAGDVNVESGNRIEYDSSLSGVSIQIGSSNQRPGLTFLHVTVKEVEVEG